MYRVIIFANGQLTDPRKARGIVSPEDYVICADGGTHHAFTVGAMPHIVIGDLDSLQESDRQRIEIAGVRVQQYSHDKNETDFELALRHALEQRPMSILVIGAAGGRLDQTVANLAALSDPALAALEVRADDGVEEALFCRKQAQVRGTSGDLVSLIPWGGAVEGVRTTGLRWPLHNKTLYPYKTRGVSNEMLGDVAQVSVASGLLLVIHRRHS
jgi:thiamine pyrophosphokinase